MAARVVEWQPRDNVKTVLVNRNGGEARHLPADRFVASFVESQRGTTANAVTATLDILESYERAHERTRTYLKEVVREQTNLATAIEKVGPGQMSAAEILLFN
eukprot:TRINITY_DN7423_c0_g1_i2.p1 TRINITY_DN7423_c0_g1~~TRINITY_DN7423_c0_g1_i2.p1  ORF type:complete len:103 (+),score=15.45 TRINITY_DN7423_c0_g1_i2:240-548(+)